jgi:ATP-dependent protease ClpP protease subunit
MANNELWIYDEVNPDSLNRGVTPKKIRDELAKLPRGRLTVRINSPGGEVFAGTAIHSLLAEWPGGVAIRIDGVAASIASYIAMAGDRIEMADGAMLMIHEPWTGTIGDADEHEAQAKLLRQVTGTLASAYSAKTKGRKSDAAIRAALKAETWLTSDEAIAFGLADAKVRTPAAAYNIPLHLGYKNVPMGLRNRVVETRWTTAKLAIDIARARAALVSA